MSERTRAGHFLLELLLAIAIFSVCAAVCIWLFFEAFSTANDARDLNYALAAAKSAWSAAGLHFLYEITLYDYLFVHIHHKLCYNYLLIHR